MSFFVLTNKKSKSDCKSENSFFSIDKSNPLDDKITKQYDDCITIINELFKDILEIFDEKLFERLKTLLRIIIRNNKISKGTKFYNFVYEFINLHLIKIISNYIEKKDGIRDYVINLLDDLPEFFSIKDRDTFIEEIKEQKILLTNYLYSLFYVYYVLINLNKFVIEYGHLHSVINSPDNWSDNDCKKIYNFLIEILPNEDYVKTQKKNIDENINYIFTEYEEQIKKIKITNLYRTSTKFTPQTPHTPHNLQSSSKKEKSAENKQKVKRVPLTMRDLILVPRILTQKIAHKTGKKAHNFFRRFTARRNDRIKPIGNGGKAPRRRRAPRS